MARLNSQYDMTPDFDFTNEGLLASSNFPSFDNSAETNLDLDNPSFESVNSTATNDDLQTVSPQDIVMDINLSAPPSAAMTNLSTPQTLTWDSPYSSILHSNNTSPNFLDEDLELESSDWPSLFPNESPPDVKPSIEAASPIISTSRSTPSSMARTHSSPGGRYSSVSGVKKPRNRNKPLPDLNPEKVEDPHEKKRMRNTLAARKSRQKRVEAQSHAELEIEQLKHELDHTKAELDRYQAMFQQHIAPGRFANH
ncbi:hypothetical protein MMC10_004918 [Thelotrema lepadinum]|nr:hypothetical protein [Thelotrema lepadinum]